jgi:hypothetical protein
MDAIEVMTHEDMEKCVDRLSAKEADYLKVLISRVVRCFDNEEHHAMLVFQNDSAETVTMCAVNTDEKQAFAMLMGAADALAFVDTSAAPAKGMFN